MEGARRDIDLATETEPHTVASFLREMVIFPSNPGESTPVAGFREQLFAVARDLNRVYHEERARLSDLTEAVENLEESYLATVRTLAFVVQASDASTRSHLDRAHDYAVALARRVAPDLAGEPTLRYGALLHDIGKIGVPERVLGKPGPLTPEEWEMMRRHPTLGSDLLRPAHFLQPAASIVESHHERWDGGGYPNGLHGEEIPLEARIFAVVDSFDAMTSDRPYRQAMTVGDAVAEIERESGGQFDPEVSTHFVKLYTDGDLERLERSEHDDADHALDALL